MFVLTNPLHYSLLLFIFCSALLCSAQSFFFNGMTWQCMAWHGMAWHAMPCHAMPRHAMPCHAMLCCAMPCCAMPCHIMSCHAMSCHSMPIVMSYHTMSKTCFLNIVEGCPCVVINHCSLPSRTSRVRPPIWKSDLKKIKRFSPLTSKDSVLWRASWQRGSVLCLRPHSSHHSQEVLMAQFCLYFRNLA